MFPQDMYLFCARLLDIFSLTVKPGAVYIRALVGGGGEENNLAENKNEHLGLFIRHVQVIPPFHFVFF